MSQKITPVNKVLLSIDKALEDEIALDGGIKLYKDPAYNPEWNVSVTGKIAEIPDNAPIPVKKGDEVAFSYKVVAETTFNDNEKHVFHSMTDDMNPKFRKYANSMGEWIVVRAIPGILTLRWIGVYKGRDGKVISGVDGTEQDLNKFLSQFAFQQTDNVTYNNLIRHGKNNYWKANYDQIFAKKVKGHIVSISDRVICFPIDVEVPPEERIINGIHIPDMMMTARLQNKARVLSGGEKIGLKKDDIILFNPRFLEKYELWGREYYVIKEKRIEATWQQEI